MDRENYDGTIQRGDWRELPEHMEYLPPTHHRKPTVEAKQVWRELTAYFSTVGSVAWQDHALTLWWQFWCICILYVLSPHIDTCCKNILEKIYESLH